MTLIPQTQEDLQGFIDNGAEENQNLEYKSSGALLNNGDKLNVEIAKDVSAMANASGGMIIYGIKEFDQADKKHLPEKLTGIDRSKFSKERLEHIIDQNISPRIEGLRIHVVSLKQIDEAVYIIEIPQSKTAHQNTKDCRYYKRHEFEVQRMYDYEIRDIMNRATHPVIEMAFEIEKYTYEVKDNPYFPAKIHFNFPGNPQPAPEKEYNTISTLRIYPVNNGNVFAQYINYFVLLPRDIVDEEKVKDMTEHENGSVEFYGENTFRDVVDYQHNPFGGITKYGPSRFDPVLPKLRGRSEKLKLVKNPLLNSREITWTVYADNATPRTGSISLNEITIIERIKQETEDE